MVVVVVGRLVGIRNGGLSFGLSLMFGTTKSFSLRLLPPIQGRQERDAGQEAQAEAGEGGYEANEMGVGNTAGSPVSR